MEKMNAVTLYVNPHFTNAMQAVWMTQIKENSNKVKIGGGAGDVLFISGYTGEHTQIYTHNLYHGDLTK